MLNGLYTLVRGMIGLEKGRDVLANNLANADTTAFKQEDTVYQSFPEVLMSRLDESGKQIIGSKGNGSKLAMTYTDFRQGTLRETGNPFDFAIEGAGFFVIQTFEGEAYTRDGRFTQNNAGHLVTEDGYPVMGQFGPISTNAGDISVGQNGAVFVNGVQIDQIQIVDFADPQGLNKVGDNLYRTGDGIIPERINGEIQQGYIEGSNVNLIMGMTQMITATRLYEMSQKALQAQDETLSKAVNEVGKTS